MRGTSGGLPQERPEHDGAAHGLQAGLRISGITLAGSFQNSRALVETPKKVGL